VTFRNTTIYNCSGSGVDISNWVRHHIALEFDGLTIGRGVARMPWYWPEHPTSGPTVPIALGPYDDDPNHLVGGVTFRNTVVDMRDFVSRGTRPWLSSTYVDTPVGMADVIGDVVVLSGGDASMCEIGDNGPRVNVTVAVNCTGVVT